MSKNQMNQEIIDEIENQNHEEINHHLYKFLAEQIEKNKANGIFFGLSGGIDSVVLHYLCKRS